MAHGMRRRAPLQRKIPILQPASASKPVGDSFAVSVALLLYIRKLKLELAALARDYCALYASNRQLLKHAGLLKNEVTVEKVENTAQQSYLVRISCERTGSRLVSTLEAFEKMGLSILQARVSCDRYFAMEAIAVATAQAQPLKTKDVAQSILEALEQQKEEEEEGVGGGGGGNK